MRSRTLTIRLIEKRLFTTLIVALFILGGFYSYLLVSSVVNVIVREEAEQEIAQLNSTLSDMEFAYIKQQDTIDLTRAHSLGFTDATEKLFVSRRSVLGQNLTLDGDSRTR